MYSEQVGVSREKVAQAQLYAIKSLEMQMKMLQDAVNINVKYKDLI